MLGNAEYRVPIQCELRHCLTPHRYTALRGAPHHRRGRPLGAEFTLAYGGRPSYSVSVREFLDGKAARETQ
jgi:hypothetical protein